MPPPAAEPTAWNFLMPRNSMRLWRSSAGALLRQRIGTVVGAPRIADDAVARLDECRLLIAPDQRTAGGRMHEYHRNAVAARVPVPKPGIGQRRQRLLCGCWSGKRHHEARTRIWYVLGRRGARHDRREQCESNPFGEIVHEILCRRSLTRRQSVCCYDASIPGVVFSVPLGECIAVRLVGEQHSSRATIRRV